MAKDKQPEQAEKDPLSLFIKKSQTWVEKYFKYALGLVVIGVLSFGLSMLYLYWQKNNNHKAEENLYQIKKQLMAEEVKAGGNILSFNTRENFFGQNKKAEYTPEMEKLATQYVDVIKKWVPKPATLLASAEVAHFFYQYGKYNQAIDLLELSNAYKKANTMGFLLAFQLGAYLMDQKKYDKAINTFNFITQHEKAKWLWPEALLKEALSYEKQNNIEQAKKLYQQIKKDFSDSQASGKATQYLNLLQLKNQIKQNSSSKTKEQKNDEG